MEQFEFVEKRKANIKDDILSGLTVALALVPEAVAFAFVAGVPPLVGLYAAFMVGLITSIFGGRPGMISGATGAMAVVMVSLVKDGNSMGSPDENLGLFYLFVTVILAGILQVIAGVFKMGKFVRLIPHPVMMGFVNGLAIVIFLSQLGMFKDFSKDYFGNKLESVEAVTPRYFDDGSGVFYDKNIQKPIFEKQKNHLISVTNQKEYLIEGENVYDLSSKSIAFVLKDGAIFEIEKQGFVKEFKKGKELYLMIALVLLTMLIMWGLPKISKKKIPAALIGILVVSAIAILGKLDVDTVGSFIKDGGGDGLKGGLPMFQSELFDKIPLNFETLKFIFPYALILAAIGLIESLMTLNLVDELTNTKGNSNKECIAQGASNIVNGFFGGMGGCAMIGQSIINIKSGGRTRLSGIVAAVTLLVFILFASAYIEMVPIAALVGVMFMVVIGTFAWNTFKIFGKIPLHDIVVVLIVTILTVIFDLAIAVLSGVVVSALVFSWENAKRIRARKSFKGDGTKVYEIWGPLFFGSIQAFNAKFKPEEDPVSVEIDFMESKVQDYSGIEAIANLVRKYEAQNKEVVLKHLSSDCIALLSKADSSLVKHIEQNVDDPRYYVVAEVHQ
ncbi:MAG: SulP family inorganic anion transporter [Flavobacteriales bacterium]|jgi:SulP family sulfate permease|nr:SulP family inorganic anion transporter [Flavobacteriales bacterium]